MTIESKACERTVVRIALSRGNGLLKLSGPIQTRVGDKHGIIGALIGLGVLALEER
jgi:hypothetical protein